MLSPSSIPSKRNSRATSNWSIDSGYGSGLHEDTKLGIVLDARDDFGGCASQKQNQPPVKLGDTRVPQLQLRGNASIKKEEHNDEPLTPRLRLCTNISNPSSPDPVSPASPSEVRRSHARKTASKLPSHAVGRLTAWLDANRHHPYPTAEAKQALADACSITIKQVTTWFTNTRQRQLKTQENEGRGGIGHDHTSTQASRKGKKKNYGRSNGASPVDGLLSPRRLSPCPSISENSSGEGDNWQCTFCGVSLTSKSWRRHEETQHYPKHQWTCLAFGPRVTLQSSSSSVCAFCELLNPDDDHFQYHHRIGDCMCKAEHERTFGRPDHLQQHARNFHKCEKPLSELVREAWRRDGPGSVDNKSWSCGFCQEVLQTWDARATHIAGHFKAGTTMAQWRDHLASRSTLPQDYTTCEEPTMLDALTGMGASFAGPSNYRPVQVNHTRVDSAQHRQSEPATSTGFMPMSATIPDITFDPFCMYGNPIDTFNPPTTGSFTSYPTQNTATTSSDPSIIDFPDVQFDINGNPIFDHSVWNSW